MSTRPKYRVFWDQRLADGRQKLVAGRSNTVAVTEATATGAMGKAAAAAVCTAIHATLHTFREQ
jgi:hypothetical protein